MMLKSINKKNYINGSWVSCSNNIKVYNPSNNEVIAEVPDLPKEKILEAIDDTVKKAEDWRYSNLDQRYEVLRNWYQLIRDNREELASIITLEQGKVISEAYKEIDYALSYVDWFACIVKSHKNYSRYGSNINHRILVDKEPIGAVAAITPWNFPLAMIARKIAPALAAGCSIILKPSEFTPLSALVQAVLLEKSGLPAGVLNVVTCNAKLFGDLICQDFRIRKISFTGSTRVGKLLYEKSAPTLKRMSLELGGNSPYIIFADADQEKVAEELINVKLRSGGQSCTSPNRVFIEKSIYESFVKLISDKFGKCKVGDGFNKSNKQGPLINSNAVEKVNLLLQEAINDGAKISCGGKYKNNFVEPTVIYDCQDDMSIFSNEIFGPVIACYSFDNVDEVISRANNTEYGLQSYLYTKDLAKANMVASKLDFNMVSVNSSMPGAAKAPFSGRKASGFGIEGSDEGIEEFLNTKYINWNY